MAIKAWCVEADQLMVIEAGIALSHRSSGMGKWPGMHWRGSGLSGGPRSGWTGGWRRLPKRLGAVTVGYKCH